MTAPITAKTVDRLACPPWCTTSHDTQPDPDGRVVRLHRCERVATEGRTGMVTVHVAQAAVFDPDTGVTVADPAVVVHGGGLDGTLTIPQARALARALDSVTAAVDGTAW